MENKETDEYDRLFDDEAVEELKIKKPVELGNIQDVKEYAKKLNHKKELVKNSLNELKEVFEGKINAIHVNLFGSKLDTKSKSKISKVEDCMDDFYLKDLPILKAVEPVIHGIIDLGLNYKELHTYYKREISEINELLDSAMRLLEISLVFYDDLEERFSTIKVEGGKINEDTEDNTGQTEISN